MKRIFFDLETYYSKTYSLRKMTPIEYVLGAEYETVMCAVAEDDKPKFILDGDDVARYFKEQTEPYMAISHNALFDCVVLAFAYNIHPTLCVDTMGMARALLRHQLPQGRVGLDNVAKFLGLGEKIQGALVNVIGMHRQEIKDRGLWDKYVAYAGQDVDLCRGIYNTLKSKFPATEHVIMDMVIKMCTQPSFRADTNKLYEHLWRIQADKANLLDRIGLAKEDMLSNDKFAAALQNFGVDPPRKISPATGRETWAFAKTDEEFTDLEEHPNPDVQALMSARFGVKSTLEETRTERLISMAQHTEATYGEPILPIPLRYGGAHTHRFSGDYRINAQNLPSRKDTILRSSLVAADGYVVFAIDASQIEARLTAWLAGQWDLVEAFDQGRDVYSEFATRIYRRPITKADKLERTLGKICILALGFGMGFVKLQATIRIEAAKSGYDILLSLEECKRIVDLYRATYPAIRNLWYWLNAVIARMASGTCVGETLGPCVFEKNAILLPNGLRLFYEDLRYVDGNWSFWYEGKRKRLYGGKLLENIIQALDRVCVMGAAIAIKTRARASGFTAHLAHQVHDELIYVPRIDLLQRLRVIAMEEMSRRPWWGPDLPLMAEAKAGPSYGELVAL